MLNKNKVLFLIAVFSLQFTFGQKGSQSPYSIFGLGELNNGEYSVFQSMGGVLAANSDSTVVNHLNPATYSYTTRHLPIFQVGLNGKLSTFSTETSTINRQHFGLNQFQLGIPIKKRWGAGFGLMPYSFSGYTVSNTVANGDDTTKFINEGSGGISKLHLGVSYKIISEKGDSISYKDTTKGDSKNKLVYGYHTLSFGVNANYLFGSSEQYKSYEHVTFSNSYNSRVESGLRLKGYVFDLGLSYQLNFSNKEKKNNKGLGVGLTYTPAMKIKGFEDVLSFSYLGSYYTFGLAPFIIDTIENISDNQGSVYLPESYRFGLEYRSSSGEGKNLVRIASDVSYQKWSTFYTDFGSSTSDSLRDRLGIGLGIEYTPSGALRFRSTEPFFGRLSYRIGINYTQTELNVLNSTGDRVNIDNYGMSFGIGLPVVHNRSNTNINFGATFGNLGTTENGLIQEKYIGLFFGVSITPGWGDFWFIKRKYD